MRHRERTLFGWSHPRRSKGRGGAGDRVTRNGGRSHSSSPAEQIGGGRRDPSARHRRRRGVRSAGATGGTVLNAPFAFVTIVDGTRSFWKSCIGVDRPTADRQNPVEESFCQYVVNTDEPLIVGEPPRRDDRQNPSIEKMGVVAWAGYPLRSTDGHVLGTFCVVDTVVRDWTPRRSRSSRRSPRCVERDALRILLDEGALAAVNTRREIGPRATPKLAEHSTAADTTDEVAASITDFGPGVLGGRVHRSASSTAQRRRWSPRLVADSDDLMSTTAPCRSPRPPDRQRQANPVASCMRRQRRNRKRFPHGRSCARWASGATASVPFRHPEGRVFGALTAGWSKSRFRSGAGTVRRRCCDVRADSSNERDSATCAASCSWLQKELLPDASGEWGRPCGTYPATTGHRGRRRLVRRRRRSRRPFGVVVGDVPGHGIKRRPGWQVRGTINAVARMLPTTRHECSTRPSNMLQQSAGPLHRHRRDLRRGPGRPPRSTYLSAGHPPQLCCARPTAVVPAGCGIRPVLGSGQGPADVDVVPFSDGAVLVSFTDGLVERRDQTTDEGTDRIAKQLQRALTHSSPSCWRTRSSMLWSPISWSPTTSRL